MSFRLVPKSVTLNDLERRNGRYIALFHWIVNLRCRKRSVAEFMQESVVFLVRVQCRRKESSRSLSHLLMSFLFYHFPWTTTFMLTTHIRFSQQTDLNISTTWFLFNLVITHVLHLWSLLLVHLPGPLWKSLIALFGMTPSPPIDSIWAMMFVWR